MQNYITSTHYPSTFPRQFSITDNLKVHKLLYLDVLKC